MIKEIFDKLIERKYIKKRIEALTNQIEETKKLTDTKLIEYDVAIVAMTNDISKYKLQIDKILLENAERIKDICDISDKISEMNDTFYVKVELLGKSLENGADNSEISKLTAIINEDICSLKKLHQNMEEYARYREAELYKKIEARKKHQIDREYER